MGNIRNKNMHLGVIRGGAIERLIVASDNNMYNLEEEKLKKHFDKRMRSLQMRKRLWTPMCQIMILEGPLQVIKNTFNAFSSIFTKKVVLHKVLSDHVVVDINPNPNAISKDTLVEKELISRLMQLLSKVNRSNDSMKLATKHVMILIIIVNGHLTLCVGRKFGC
jgi:hypothetical protein